MAAVTADPLTLPRIRAARPEETEREVLGVSAGPTGFEGLGFPVRRTMAGINYRYTDPFIMMDHMGEVDYAAGEPKGTDWHPHRGFETVTYLIEGAFRHQDSHGGGGVITPGATQWMTAGGGVLHIETPPVDLVEEGGLFNGFQLWVNLPAKDKMQTPKYQPVEADDVLLLATDDAGALLRVIAGELDGHVGPGSTHTPITMLHASIAPGAQLSLPWQRSFNALAYVFGGSGTAGPSGAQVTSGDMVVFGEGDRLLIRADEHLDSRAGSPDAKQRTMEVLLLGGEPIGEPMAAYGPFVMNSRAELQQALQDYQTGKFGVIPPDAIMPHVPSGAPRP